MKVTFILRDFTDVFYNGNGGSIVGLLTQSDADKFTRLSALASDGRVSIKVGNGSFRDRVELNTIMRHHGPASFTIEPRRGYRLAIFTF